MKKFYPYVMAFALMSGCVVYGSAQTTQSRQPAVNVAFQGHAWEEGRKQAHEMGYQDGLNDGHHDFETHHSFRPTHDDNYRHADRGYVGNFGDKGRYQQDYREGYERGYDQGYHHWEHHEHGYDHN